MCKEPIHRESIEPCSPSFNLPVAASNGLEDKGHIDRTFKASACSGVELSYQNSSKPQGANEVVKLRRTTHSLKSRRNAWMASPAVTIKNSSEAHSSGAGLAGDAKSLGPCRLPSWESSPIITLSGNGSLAAGSSTTLSRTRRGWEVRNCVKSSLRIVLGYRNNQTAARVKSHKFNESSCTAPAPDF